MGATALAIALKAKKKAEEAAGEAVNISVSGTKLVVKKGDD